MTLPAAEDENTGASAAANAMQGGLSFGNIFGSLSKGRNNHDIQ